jgi:tripartite-type tricarboxylate transporter receptor subunit TctC
MGDFLPGYEASAWYGIAVPVGTPASIVERLNHELNAAFADPRMKAHIAELGGTPLPGSPDDFRKLFAAETEKWAPGWLVLGAGLVVVVLDFVCARFAKQRRAARRVERALAA